MYAELYSPNAWSILQSVWAQTPLVWLFHASSKLCLQLSDIPLTNARTTKANGTKLWTLPRMVPCIYSNGVWYKGALMIYLFAQPHSFLFIHALQEAENKFTFMP